jgi:hypothetical protein
MLLTLDLDLDLLIDPASRDFRDAYTKRALLRSVAEAGLSSMLITEGLVNAHPQ